MTDVSFCVNSWAVAETSTRIPSAPSKLKVDLTVHIEGWLVTQCLLQTSVSSYKIEMLWIDQQLCRLPGKFGSKVMSQKRPPWLRLGRSFTTSGGIVCGVFLHMSHTDPSNSWTQRRKISACFLNFTIHASKVPFHANFMLLNDLQNERQFPTKFLNMGWPPPPVWTMFKKTALFWKEGIPKAIN